ncbi:MAG: hydrogenase [Candidatus Hydrogenedentes bacterium]|nr:hydrogenase [Candidatus Hydrogenedentota bacterium]
MRKIPIVSLDTLRESVVKIVADNGRIISLFGSPRSAGKTIRLYAVLSTAGSGGFLVLASDIADSYPALTPDCIQAYWFEREIAEQWGVRPEGHPWLKPVRFHHSYRPSHDAWGRGPNDEILPGVTDFYRVECEEVHEVAVGPVHHLEISLGYQHRGIERALLGGPNKRTVHYMETLAGDTTIGHTLAYCQGIEALTEANPSFRAQEIRGIALELERLANHAGDLGALAGDVGYLPTASFCGRLRGDFLNMTALVCGSRFGRGWARPGGMGFDLTPQLCSQLLERIEAAYRDTKAAVDLLWNTPSVMARFEQTGGLTPEMCALLGLVGVPARACGMARDVRFEFPAGIYRFINIPLTTWTSGDVFARAQVRWWEISHSVAFVREQLAKLSDGPIRTDPVRPLAPNTMTVSLVEGWRGEICHTMITDEAGRIAHYKVVDPSFHNWMGLAIALRGQQISDFPLCNKSFNLSYCGTDL